MSGQSKSPQKDKDFTVQAKLVLEGVFEGGQEYYDVPSDGSIVEYALKELTALHQELLGASDGLNETAPIGGKQVDTLSLALDELVEKKYQLRLEHNHYDMKWYAYYAERGFRLLHDDDIDWETASDTPLEAVTKLTDLVATGRVPSNASLIRHIEVDPNTSINPSEVRPKGSAVITIEETDPQQEDK